MPDKVKATKKSKKKPAKQVRAAKATVSGAKRETTPAGATTTLPISGIPISSLPIGTVPVSNPPINKIPIGTIVDQPIRPFPIFINTNPAISSLSPSGAVVGGSDFELTVLGSNFGTGSTVQWNQSARKTTVVSATQLTAAISAADLAAVQSASVAVSNQGAAGTAPVFSNSVQFSVIPDISAIISQLQAITAIPANLLAELQTYITIKQSQVDTLTSQVSTDQTTAAGLNSQIANLQTQVTQQQAQINTLTSQLQAAKSQSASPLDVAQSFKSVVDQIQAAAQAAGGTQSTVSNMTVQLKSLVSVQAATANTPASASMIFPDPTALPDPQHLSTLSFSFGAIPRLPNAAIPSPAPAPSTVAPASSAAPAAAVAAEPAGVTAPAEVKEEAAATVKTPVVKPAKVTKTEKATKEAKESKAVKSSKRAAFPRFPEGVPVTKVETATAAEPGAIDEISVKTVKAVKAAKIKKPKNAK